MRNLLLFLHSPPPSSGWAAWASCCWPCVPRPTRSAAAAAPALMVQVLRRFFVLVIASIAVLLATGVPLLMQVPGAQAPRGWHAMAGLGVLMVLVFGHIFFAPWRRMQRAVAAQEWPEGGRRVNQIALLVKVNFALGWIAIAAVMLWR